MIQKDVLELLDKPKLARNAVFIIEPWEHVGVNSEIAPAEDVQASKNAAYALQKIADCDSVLLPAWKSGVIDVDLIVPVFSSGLAVIIEGGDPSVQKAETFSHPECPRDDIFALVEGLLLSRSPTSAPQLYICLGHQLAAECHVRLIRRAVKEVLETESIFGDEKGRVISALKNAANRIKTLGENTKIVKGDGRVAADSWMHPEFVVSKNEVGEVGKRQLLPYETPEPEDCGLPLEVVEAHEKTADRNEGVIGELNSFDMHRVSSLSNSIFSCLKRYHGPVRERCVSWTSYLASKIEPLLP